MKRISIDKNDSVATVIERVIGAEEAEIVLVIPRQTAFRDAADHLSLIKREAVAAGKTVRVESVDEDVLRLAESAGLGAMHPLFADAAPRSFSDIVPGGAPAVSPRPAVVKKLSVEPEPRREAEVRTIVKPQPRPEPKPEDSDDDDNDNNDDDNDDDEKPRKRRSLRPVAIGTVAVLALGAIVWAVGLLFARAEIAIAFRKEPWSFDAKVSGGKTVNAVDAAKRVIPVEIFRSVRNTTQIFPASGRANVSQKAKGRLVVYNAYSSAPQPLVATTRFVTPDGKIFRLVSGITVPGAAIKDSKIVPASIETDVIADQPGVEHNLGAVERLDVPGFKGSPKYDGFYGSLISASGGFVGERAVPTDADIAAAKERVAELLKKNLEEQPVAGEPERFVVPDGAKSIAITRTSVNVQTDDKGNFSVSGEAELREAGFREDDLRALLTDLASGGNEKLTLANLAISYRDASPDFSAGTLSLTVSASGTLTTAFDEGNFRSSVAGKSFADARAAISAFEGFVNAEISVKPRWLRALPENPEKISVRVE